MSQEKIPAADRITSSFKQLAVASKDLNVAANELGKTISLLEDALKPLNLGVSAWVQIAGHEDDDGGSYWTRDIGYARVGHKWGIALRKTWGHNGYDQHDEEVWLFNDAPRWMCIESIGKLPELFDDLIERTQDTTKKLKARTDQTKELVAAINTAAAEIAPKRK